MRKGDIEGITIPLPPHAEQTRIAQKLDELLVQVDTLKARIGFIPELLKRFRQSTLTAAVSGVLTEEWRAAAKLNLNWEKTSIGSICNKAFDGPFGSKLKSDDYTVEGARVVRLENIGHLIFNEDKKTYIGEEKFEQLSKNTLEAGDVLFSSFVDEEIRVCQLPKSEESFINKADCFCLRVDSFSANPAFVMYALAAGATYRRIKEAVHGATRPRINLGFLKAFEINLPSIQEQNEIVRRIEQLFAFVAQLEARVQAAQVRINQLTPSILVKAFSGELLPQNYNDEPAVELIARIAAERSRNLPAKKIRKSRQSGIIRPLRESTTMSKRRQDKDVLGQPYLRSHLHRLGSKTTADVLFKTADLSIADFYKQLAWEVEQGFIQDHGHTLEASDAP
ncbi:hypothetical protein C1Y11_12645 [Pseudomonas sp. FW305-20]|nr:hypothetical protein C1Y11_12645 [Pseudomonas sp. FW305-20]PMU42455.1 hypothetical protein C1Y12_05220 [Pseudomonas sp. FW305-47B]